MPNFSPDLNITIPKQKHPSGGVKPTVNDGAASLINAVVPDSAKHGYKYPSSPTAKPSDILSNTPDQEDLEKRFGTLAPHDLVSDLTFVNQTPFIGKIHKININSVNKPTNPVNEVALKIAIAPSKQPTSEESLKTPQENGLAIELSKQLAEIAATKKRYPIGLEVGQNIIGNQIWYKQIGKTCGAWSVVNAMSALGNTPTSEEVASFHLEQINYGDLQSIITQVDGMSFDIVRFKTDLKGSAHLPFYPEKPAITQEELEGNAQLVKQLIDSRQILLVTINPSIMYKDTSKAVPLDPQKPTIDIAAHAIAIVGYRVNSEGYMDVLFVDSNFGLIWTSIEHMSESLYPESGTYVGYLQESSLENK